MVSMPYNQSYPVIRKSNCSLESETEFSLIVIECRPTMLSNLKVVRLSDRPLKISTRPRVRKESWDESQRYWYAA